MRLAKLVEDYEKDIILTVAHDIFKGISLDDLRKIMNSPPIIIDVRGFFDIPEINNLGIIYKRL